MTEQGGRVTSLLKRLSDATGGSEDLDRDIALQWIGNPELLGGMPVPRYSRSLDAALTLIPERWDYELDNDFGTRYRATVSFGGNSFAVVAETGPLAVCIAALLALSI